MAMIASIMMSALRAVLRVVWFPLLVGAVVVGGAACVNGGVDLFVSTSLLWSATLLVLVPLERIIPHERRWLVPDGQLPHDVGHTLLGSVVGSRVGAVVVDGIAAGVGAVGAVAVGASASFLVWPAGWPLMEQLALAYVAIDFLRYWQHRLQHAWAPLWATHELHHDPRRLNAFKAGRSHLLDRAQQSLCVLPLVVVGAPASIIVPCAALNGVIGLIAHANVDCRAGPLGFILVGPEQHRVHHSADLAHSHANFGASLIVWDRFFGTMRAHQVRDVGVHDDTPEGFVAQLARPVNRWLGY
jgi:sterol desaturase/sphingolipid hydroxylase (fatty acid hydroxylase superfamily)